MLAHGVSRNTRIVAKHGLGCWLTDVHGQSYLDFTAGIGALSTGHSHPHVVAAVCDQVPQIVHAQQNCVYTHPQQQRVLRYLSAVLPPQLNSVFFTNSGSEAVENAIKVARAATGRPNVVSFVGGFHGRTLGAMALSSSRVSCRQGFQPLMPGVFQLDYPLDPPHFRQQLETLFERQSAPEETAAVVLEPVLGEGGVQQAHAEAVAHLREECTRHGILWISDEVQTGMGRTGAWWGYEHFGVEPDAVIFGKGIASGFPLAGVAAAPERFAAIQPNGLGGTYNGNAVVMAAAAATFEVFHAEDLVQAAQYTGQKLAQQLRDLQHPLIREVRQYGLMLAVELELPRSALPDVLALAPAHGLLLLGTGLGATVRLLPPLTVQDADLAVFVRQFAALLGAVGA
jgi:4-aminobutyrate aminotransferase